MCLCSIFCHLSTLPNLELCLSSNKSPKKLIECKSNFTKFFMINQFERKIESAWFNYRMYIQFVMLPTIKGSNHDHETSFQHKNSCQAFQGNKLVQSWTTPNTLLCKWINKFWKQHVGLELTSNNYTNIFINLWSHPSRLFWKYKSIDP